METAYNTPHRSQICRALALEQVDVKCFGENPNKDLQHPSGYMEILGSSTLQVPACCKGRAPGC